MAGQPSAYRFTAAPQTRARRSQLEVAALNTAPGCLRLHAKHVLSEWGLTVLSDVAELLVSEVATNAVLAAPATTAAPSWPGRPSPRCPCVELRLSVDHRALVIELWDGSPDPPPPASLPDADALSGRGLFLVQELSDRWGFYFPALPHSGDMRDFDRFRFSPSPVPQELRPVTGKVVWFEFQQSAGTLAASR
jgi:anti-sigma regulatory factor (Ser/Thr protein kinase)